MTGIVFNSFNASPNVLNVAAGKTALFLFCSEDGVISGWNYGVDATNAKILVNNSASGAVYKGCALGGTAAAPLFFAANFNSGKVDVFDGKFLPVSLTGAFQNPMIPAGFAPFNVQVIQGRVFVTYARQNAAKHDDVAGAGSGFLATYDLNGNLMSNLVAQGVLNSPWGIALAPATFGAFGGDLLVGNLRDGRINAFDPNTGVLLGTLQDPQGNPIKIPGLMVAHLWQWHAQQRCRHALFRSRHRRRPGVWISRNPWPVRQHPGTCGFPDQQCRERRQFSRRRHRAEHLDGHHRKWTLRHAGRLECHK